MNNVKITEQKENQNKTDYAKSHIPKEKNIPGVLLKYTE